MRAREEGGEEQNEVALAELRTKRGVLAETLSKLEVETREILLELLAEFDRRYSDIAEIDRGHYTTYFATVSNPNLCDYVCMLALQPHSQLCLTLSQQPQSSPCTVNAHVGHAYPLSVSHSTILHACSTVRLAVPV